MTHDLSHLAAGVFTSLAGLPRTSRTTTERLVALACALRLAPPSAVGEWMSGVSEVMHRVEKFERWLKEAEDDQDALLRQFLLLITAQKASEGTPHDHVYRFAQQLHRQIRR